jgi:predicted acetyltransferase
MRTRGRAPPLYARALATVNEIGVVVPSPSAHYPIGPVTADDADTFVRTAMRVFGHSLTDETISHIVEVELADPSLSIAARDDGRIVGTATVLEFDLTLPGGSTTPCAGVTTVTVMPTHRRRGVLTSLMRHQLDDLHADGWTWAGLYASEDAIYGRFGYGPATWSLRGRIDRSSTTLREPVPPASVDLLTADEALQRVPPIYDAVARVVPGMLSKSEPVWRDHLQWDPPGERGGGSERFIVAIDDRAYATYRVSEHWGDTGADSTLRVEASLATDAEAGRQLWTYLFGVDLVQHVRIHRLPVDHPLPWWLAERRRLHLQLSESFHARLVDVGAALSARGTHGEGRVVLDVADAFCPWNQRRWALEGDATRLRCEPTGDPADAALDVRELASMSLGGVDAGTLARAGLVDERAPGALSRLTELLASPRPPYNAFTF